MKFIRKGVLELYEKELVDKNFVDNSIYEVEVADEDTTIKGLFGEALITKGNYILTGNDGNQVGITAQDLQNQFDEV